RVLRGRGRDPPTPALRRGQRPDPARRTADMRPVRENPSGASRTFSRVGRQHVLERRMSRFLREAPSVRTAAGVIVTATLLVVVGGGILIRLVDEKEYADVWV